MWDNTKPNPFSFVRNSNGEGRVKGFVYCGKTPCAVCSTHTNLVTPVREIE